MAIQNCSPPSEEYSLRCRALRCQKTLQERELLPPGAVVLRSSHAYGFSDDPAKSVYIAKYEERGKFRYPMCEMRDQAVVRTAEFTAESMDW